MSTAGARLDGFRKRDGTVVPFHREKIEQAVRKAAEAVARREGTVFNAVLPGRIADRVVEYLNDPQSEYYVFPDEHGQRVPEIEDVQDLVEITLTDQGCTSIVSAGTAKRGPSPSLYFCSAGLMPWPRTARIQPF